MKHRFDLTLACFYPAVKQRHKWKSWMWLHLFIYLFLTPTRPFPHLLGTAARGSQCLIEHINMLFKSFLNCFCISHFEEGLKKHYQNSVYLWTLLLQPRIQHFSVLRYPRLALMPSYSCQIITEQLWFSLCCFYVQIRALFIWLWPHSDTLFLQRFYPAHSVWDWVRVKAHRPYLMLSTMVLSHSPFHD